MFESLKKKLLGFLGKTEEKKTKKPKKAKKSQKTKEKKPEKVKEKKVSKSEKTKKVEDKKEIEMPLEFNAATQKFEPDLEKLKENARNIKKKTEKIENNLKSKKTLKEEIEELAGEKKEIEEKPETEEKVEKEIEEVIEKEESEEKKGNFFTRLFKKMSGPSELSNEQFDEFFSQLEIILLENNVALEVVEKIKNDLSASIVGMKIKKVEIEARIMLALKESILSVLIDPPDLIQKIKEKSQSTSSPFVILFFGINGSGKTTSIAKLANKLKKSGISCVLAAADTFRAASIEQLQTHAQKLQIPIIAHKYGADPSAVAFDAIVHAKANKIQVVLIDTAGRMYTKQNLLKEMEKIVRVSSPDLKIFVGESITGNDATEQAKTFNETAGIDGIILSKADVDDKAGTILSVSYVTKKPIYFLGTGQEYKDLTDFKKDDVIKHLGL